MKLLDNTIELIKHHEGFSAEPYLCPAEVWTIGYGHTGDVSAHTIPISEAYGEQLLREDIKTAERSVAKCVSARLSDAQYSALVSFVFNLGEGNFRRSTLLKKLNAKDYLGAANEFDRWVYGGGRKLKGLEKRRKAEKELFLNNDA